MTQRVLRKELVAESPLSKDSTIRVIKELTAEGKIQPHYDRQHHNRISFTAEDAEVIRAAIQRRVKEKAEEVIPEPEPTKAQPEPQPSSTAGVKSVEEFVKAEGQTKKETVSQKQKKEGKPESDKKGGGLHLPGGMWTLVIGGLALIVAGRWLFQKWSHPQPSPQASTQTTTQLSPAPEEPNPQDLIEKWKKQFG